MAATRGKHIHENSQASATGHTLFGVFHLRDSQQSRMTCAKVPPESWASQCVKKAPHGAELCNRKKKKRERKQSSWKPGWGRSRSLGARPRASAAAGSGSVFSSDCAFFSKSLTLGLWPPEGPDAVLSSKVVWPAVRFEGDLAHTRRHPQTHASPLASALPQPALVSHSREEHCPETDKALQPLGAWQGGEARPSFHTPGQVFVVSDSVPVRLGVVRV